MEWIVFSAVLFSMTMPFLVKIWAARLKHTTEQARVVRGATTTELHERWRWVDPDGWFEQPISEKVDWKNEGF